MRHTADFMWRRILARSSVDLGSPVVEGVHCRMWTGRSLRGGYPQLWDGERLRQASHLVFEAFRGRPLAAGKDALHRCDRPGCVEFLHLWEGTHAENMADRDAKGRNGGWKTAGHHRPNLACRGTGHPLSKLTEDGARTIKRRLRRARFRCDRPASLAREFGVSEGLVRSIRDGRSWAWLT